MTANLILEVGTEEIPARFLPPALEELAHKTGAVFLENNLDYGTLNTYGTPRRLVLYIQNLDDLQKPVVTEVKGPSLKAAYDTEGNPTKAAVGFASKQGLAVQDLEVREVGGEKYIFAVREEERRKTIEILPELVTEVIKSLSFPKSMRWGESDFRFIRPIRWLLCLYGEEVVKFTLAGVKADRFTQGHRFLCPERIPLETADAYFETVQKSYVVVDPVERRELIWSQIQDTATAQGGIVFQDEGLLNELTGLVEYPCSFSGSFPRRYLDLPEPVLVTSMREHQRYFPVSNDSGELMPLFIGVHNGTDANLEVIRAGNEKVLRARLADAEFFFQEDLQKPLAAKSGGLEKVVFQENLGTLADKVERLKRLAQVLAQETGATHQQETQAIRAAALSKNDLLTNMVGEFPELQGIMGEEYARRSGEEDAVARALREQYLPNPAGDRLPCTVVGRILALADRIDNLVGTFGLGMQPSGSQDPYALRRQALGICHILLAGDGLHLDLGKIIDQAYAAFTQPLKLSVTEVQLSLQEFFAQRLRRLFKDRGLAYDTVDAVLASGWQDIRESWERALFLQKFREQASFEDVYVVFTRTHNLAQKATSGQINPALFEDPVEDRLYQDYQQVKSRVAAAIEARDYRQAFLTLAELRSAVDTFFDTVMVMTEDEAVRENRLALLKVNADLFRPLADLSLIVKEE